MSENNCGKSFVSYKNIYNGNILLFPYRCKNRKECLTCAKEYSSLKFMEYRDILTKIVSQYGYGDFYYGELTIPTYISDRLRKNKKNYVLFKKCGSNVIKSIFGSTPALIVFQNWEKKNPIVHNWHIHYFITPWDNNGKIVDYNPSNYDILYSWKYELYSNKLIKENEKEQIKFVNLEKISRNSYSIQDDVLKRVLYMCKEPIELVDSTKMTKEEFKKFINVVSSIKKRFHRFSWTNWLSNSLKSKTLLNMEILIEKECDFCNEYRLYCKDGIIKINNNGEREYIPKNIITEDNLIIKAKDTDIVVIEGDRCKIVKERVR